MPESAYGPPYSGDAMDAAEDACAAAGEGRMGAKVALDAAHDPALGLGRSVNAGWALRFLREYAETRPKRAADAIYEATEALYEALNNAR